MKYVLILIASVFLFLGCTKKQVETVLVDYQAKVVEKVEDKLQEVIKDELPPLPAEHIVINETIHFDFDCSNIRAEDVKKLDAVINKLKRRPDVVLLLIGGACEIGTWEYNKGLGYRRGNSVYVYLSQLLKNEILVVSVGEDEPVSKTELWRNRRCEIKSE